MGMSEVAVEWELPAIMIGVQSIVASVWWIVAMFVYLKNVSTDGNLKNIAGVDVLPITWWWERIGEVSGTKIYLALSQVMTFFLYLIVSFVEMIFWIVYMTGADIPKWYFTIVGYWGTIIAYAFPMIFALVQVCTQ